MEVNFVNDTTITEIIAPISDENLRKSSENIPLLTEQLFLINYGLIIEMRREEGSLTMHKCLVRNYETMKLLEMFLQLRLGPKKNCYRFWNFLLVF